MEDLPINVVDIVVLIVLLISAMMAYMRGLVHEVLSVAAWIGAILVTFWGFYPARPYARDLISMELAADVAAGAVLFVGSLVVFSIVTNMLSKGVRDSALGALDKSLGFLFGILRGAVVVCVVYLIFANLVPPAEHPSWLRAARSMPLIEAGSRTLMTLVPEEMKQIGTQTLNDVGTRAKKEASDAAFDRLVSPKPKAGETRTASGYDGHERQDMNRLIDSHQ